VGQKVIPRPSADYFEVGRRQKTAGLKKHPKVNVDQLSLFKAFLFELKSWIHFDSMTSLKVSVFGQRCSMICIGFKVCDVTG
jgi:hypothetical protein